MLEDPGRASGQGAFWAEIGVGVRVGVGGCGGKTRGGVGWITVWFRKGLG